MFLLLQIHLYIFKFNVYAILQYFQYNFCNKIWCHGCWKKRMKFYGIIERVNCICDKNDKKIDERKFWRDKENRQLSQNFHVIKITTFTVFWRSFGKTPSRMKNYWKELGWQQYHRSSKQDAGAGHVHRIPTPNSLPKVALRWTP